MSAYGVEPMDLLQRFELKELVGVTGGSGTTPDLDVIAAVILKADAEIHVAASPHYETPIVAVPTATPQQAADLAAALQEKVLDISAYKLMQRRPSILNAGERSTYFSQLKKSNDAWLGRLGDPDPERRLLLAAAAPAAAPVSTAGAAWAESGKNVFSRERTKGLI